MHRFLLAGIYVFFYSSSVNEFFDVIVLCILVFYLTIHCYHLPFKHRENNVIEAICLFLTICVFACFLLINNLNIKESSDTVNVNVSAWQDILAVFVSIFVILPIIVFVYYLVLVCKEYYLLRHNVGNAPIASTANATNVANAGAQGMQGQLLAAEIEMEAKKTTSSKNMDIDDDTQEENENLGHISSKSYGGAPVALEEAQNDGDDAEMANV